MIEAAYQALATAAAQALLQVGFITAPTDLKVDPAAPFTPTGEEKVLVRAAALVKVRTNPVRQLLGGKGPRYVVERQCRLELALAGPDRLLRAATMDAVLALLATLPEVDPTLSGAAERLILVEQADDELPPNGVSFFITYTVRVRSSDALGRTP
ncbi:hypothetical protein [uncultured Brevundimonas sp.]|uniref:hypothetical protein n=1 Tax=uncultured Brevundimonas sp. TaxID=213418 RepID=UPI0025E50609|nr:hypothetical protein [uncultured Brevundimonas sp.]